ncbi:MAG: hypothetical protein ACPG5P_04220 [Saprospiraceae bacterium]
MTGKYDIDDSKTRRDMKYRRVQDMNADLKNYQLSYSFVMNTLQIFFHFGSSQITKILIMDTVDAPNPCKKYDERWIRDYVAEIRKRKEQERIQEAKEKNKNQTNLF